MNKMDGFAVHFVHFRIRQKRVKFGVDSDGLSEWDLMYNGIGEKFVKGVTKS